MVRSGVVSPKTVELIQGCLAEEQDDVLVKSGVYNGQKLPRWNSHDTTAQGNAKLVRISLTMFRNLADSSFFVGCSLAQHFHPNMSSKIVYGNVRLVDYLSFFQTRDRSMAGISFKIIFPIVLSSLLSSFRQSTTPSSDQR